MDAVTLVTDESIDASFKWRDAIKAKEGEDYVINAKFNCDTKYTPDAHKCFKDVKISRTSQFTEGKQKYVLEFDLRHDHGCEICQRDALVLGYGSRR